MPGTVFEVRGDCDECVEREELLVRLHRPVFWVIDDTSRLAEGVRGGGRVGDAVELRVHKRWVL